MLAITVAKRYAKSLYVVAKHKNIQVEIYHQLKILSDVFTKKSLTLFYDTPTISTADKLITIFSALGDKFHPLVLHFIKLLVDNGRVEVIYRIMRNYEELMEIDQNLVKLQFKYAKKPDDTYIENLKQYLTDKLNQEVTFFMIHDPKLIGGVSLRYKDHLIDGTIQGRISRLKQALLQS